MSLFGPWYITIKKSSLFQGLLNDTLAAKLRHGTD